MKHEDQIMKCYQALAAAILKKAAQDYVCTPKGTTIDFSKKHRIAVSKKEIEQFFTQETYQGEKWAETLALPLGLRPTKMLRQLQNGEIDKLALKEEE